MNKRFSSTQKRLGENIREFRHRLGLTQEELAYRADIERSYMGQIERGEGNPSLKKLLAIANALGIELVSLFDFN